MNYEWPSIWRTYRSSRYAQRASVGAAIVMLALGAGVYLNARAQTPGKSSTDTAAKAADSNAVELSDSQLQMLSVGVAALIPLGAGSDRVVASATLVAANLLEIRPLFKAQRLGKAAALLALWNRPPISGGTAISGPRSVT